MSGLAMLNLFAYREKMTTCAWQQSFQASNQAHKTYPVQRKKKH